MQQGSRREGRGKTACVHRDLAHHLTSPPNAMKQTTAAQHAHAPSQWDAEGGITHRAVGGGWGCCQTANTALDTRVPKQAWRSAASTMH
jgi:hypothetical protein